MRVTRPRNKTDKIQKRARRSSQKIFLCEIPLSQSSSAPRSDDSFQFAVAVTTENYWGCPGFVWSCVNSLATSPSSETQGQLVGTTGFSWAKVYNKSGRAPVHSLLRRGSFTFSFDSLQAPRAYFSPLPNSQPVRKNIEASEEERALGTYSYRTSSRSV